jgi:hypothetical protein
MNAVLVLHFSDMLNVWVILKILQVFLKPILKVVNSVFPLK